MFLRADADARWRRRSPRSSTTKNDLVSRGISADKIVARGYGKDRPVADNSTPEGRADNRRVEILVRSNESTN